MGREVSLGKPSNRECANCVYPCQGGEVLHLERFAGACCKPFCPCEQFEPKAHVFDKRPALQEALQAQLKQSALGAKP